MNPWEAAKYKNASRELGDTLTQTIQWNYQPTALHICLQWQGLDFILVFAPLPMVQRRGSYLKFQI